MHVMGPLKQARMFSFNMKVRLVLVNRETKRKIISEFDEETIITS